MVSHEFRTPLGIIQSSAEILADYLDQLEPTERKEHLHSIRDNTRRMASLMEEALLFGSLDAGKMDFKPRRWSWGPSREVSRMECYRAELAKIETHGNRTDEEITKLRFLDPKRHSSGAHHDSLQFRLRL